jgi:phosphoribosylanthranilate isomerase
MWVKICGITNLEDARAAADAGADALGFVFYDRSPRNIDAASVREITSELSPSLETVGVFVDMNVDEMLDLARAAGLKAIQCHRTDLLGDLREAAGKPQSGSDTTSFEDLKMYLVLPATRVDCGFSAGPFPFGIFLDSGTAEQPGGTGKPFDWNEAVPAVAKLSKDVKVIVAGGLNADNVATAIRTLHPWGVDVSSGVEARPGKKDPQKVREFIQAVRQTEKMA